MIAPPQRVSLAGWLIEVRWCEVGVGSFELGPLERALAARGKTEKRRAEFLAGRVAAHDAARAFAAEPFEVVAQVGGEDDGRPVMAPANGVSVSISHSSGVAVAAASQGTALGIDLESASLAPDASFAREAFADGELEGWGGAPLELRGAVLALAWAAKEAALKVWGVGLRAPLGLVAVRPIGEFSKNQSGWAVALRVDGPGPVSTMAGWVGLVDDLVLVLAVPSLDVLATGRDAGECGAVG